MSRIILLGSSGSVGLNTIEVVRQHRQRFEIIAIAANSNYQVLYEQCLEFNPEYAALQDEIAAKKLIALLAEKHCKTEVIFGEDANVKIAQVEADILICAISGMTALPSIMAAADKKILLANKESLICAGKIMMQEIAKAGGSIVPLDSEHNALFRLLGGCTLDEQVEKLYITASGGPFLNRDNLEDVTLEEALEHPKWQMGNKISIDSATMANKGLEVIEARWLFDVSFNDIAIAVHPESCVHAMIAYRDGSVRADLYAPSMKVSIAYGLSYPEHLALDTDRLALDNLSLNFSQPDLRRFPCLALALEAGRQGGNYPLIFNAANEIAVDWFLQGRIRFIEIASVIEYALQINQMPPAENIEQCYIIANEVQRECANWRT